VLFFIGGFTRILNIHRGVGGGRERKGGGGWMREKFKFDTKVVKGIGT